MFNRATLAEAKVEKEQEIDREDFWFGTNHIYGYSQRRTFLRKVEKMGLMDGLWLPQIIFLYNFPEVNVNSMLTTGKSPFDVADNTPKMHRFQAKIIFLFS